MPSNRRVDNALANQGLTVIVVDDDASVRTAIGTLLRSVGYATVAFASGEEYLASRWTSGAACLIADMRMKGMSGLELQRHLADRGWSIPMIFISAHADEEARSRALHAGAAAFLSKPFDQDALLNVLCATLHGRT